jgi:3-oxocholest-4-en-26-oate---CoA ligase
LIAPGRRESIYPQSQHPARLDPKSRLDGKDSHDLPHPRHAAGASVVRENFASVLEVVADVRSERVAMTHGERSRTWRELDQRAARLAAFLAGEGIGADDRVAIALYNGIEYLESVFAVLKLRAVPVNVNYRYQAEEIAHLFSDAGVAAVIFDASLRSRVAQAQASVPSLRTLLQVGDQAVRRMGGYTAAGYESVIDAAAPLPRAARGVDHWLHHRQAQGRAGQPRLALPRRERERIRADRRADAGLAR